MLFRRVSIMQAINPSHNPSSPITLCIGHRCAAIRGCLRYTPQGWYFVQCDGSRLSGDLFSFDGFQPHELLILAMISDPSTTSPISFPLLPFLFELWSLIHQVPQVTLAQEGLLHTHREIEAATDIHLRITILCNVLVAAKPATITPRSATSLEVQVLTH